MNQKRKSSGFFPVLDPDVTYESYSAARRRYEEALVAKWLWLLEGTKKQALKPIPESMYRNMAILFENQFAASRGLLTEQTLTTDLVLPAKYTLPLIRNIFPALFINRIASMQPMPLQSGGVTNIYFLDFKREDAGDTSLTESDSDYAVNVENGVPKRIKMTMTSTSLTAVKDMLMAVWSTEVAEDARGVLGLDVESELVNQMSAEILREMEARCISDIWNGATAGDATWEWTVGSGYTEQEWYRTLGAAFIDMDDYLIGKRYRSGDWILAGRSVAKYIRKMQDFKPEPRSTMNFGDRPITMGVDLIGRIEGFWDVFVTPYIPPTLAIMGCYPRSQTDTGFILAPYIPLAPMPLVYAEALAHDDKVLPGAYVNTDKWTRNVRTRYGKKVVVGDLFARLTISEGGD